MIDWIIKNREWLFSGIGVVLVVGFCRLVLKMKFSYEKNRRSASVSHEAVALDEAPVGPLQTTSITLPTALAAELAIVTSPDRNSSSVSTVDIQQAMRVAPPLQKESVGARYVGIRIEWQGRLSSAEQKGDKVWLMLDSVEPGRFIGLILSFVVNINDYPELTIAEDGARFKVLGTIHSVSEVAVTLRGVKLEILSLCVAILNFEYGCRRLTHGSSGHPIVGGTSLKRNCTFRAANYRMPLNLNVRLLTTYSLRYLHRRFVSRNRCETAPHRPEGDHEKASGKIYLLTTSLGANVRKLLHGTP